MNFHGGDIYKYNNGKIIDFSSNINPLGVPESFAKALQERLYEFTRYPDIDYIKLRENIAGYLGIKDIDWIVPGNGAVELIYKLTAALNCKRIYSVSPTFSEYGRGAALSGREFIELPLFDADYASIDFDRLLNAIEPGSFVIICNPNNPTGTLTDKKILCAAVERLAEKDSWLAVDEAFIEFTGQYPTTSMIPELNRFGNLIVVRAVTKFFGMPGIRLGYAVCGNTEIPRSIRGQMEPWNINTAAVIAADSVLKDRTYIEETRKWLAEERNFLYSELKSIEGLYTYKSQANFHLCRIIGDRLDAWSLKERLAEKGILIRTPDGFESLSPNHFRLAVKDRESNNKLVSVLREVMKSELSY